MILDDDDLRQLMLSAEQQSAEINSLGATALPRLSRNLRQVCEASQDMWARLSQVSQTQGTEAHVLLGSRGVDLSQISQRLESLSSRDMLAPLEPAPDTDLETFVTNEFQNMLLSTIERCRHDNFERVERTEVAALDRIWVRQKQMLLNSLIEESREEPTVQSSELEHTMTGEIPLENRSLMTSVEMAYAKRVIEYNQGEMTGTARKTLVEIFKEVSLQFNDKKVPELWECMSTMMHLPAIVTEQSGDIIKCRYSPVVQTALIKQAKSFLEERYKTYMQSSVANNLMRARTGGVPGTFPLVRAFAALKESSLTFGTEDCPVEGQPVWTLIYYCLRCGDAKAALYCAQQGGAQMSSFCTTLEELVADGQLSDRTIDNLRYQYRRSVLNTSDIYKRVVYCVLGACDIREDFPEVVSTAEDYVWFKLNQVSPSPEDESRPAPALSTATAPPTAHIDLLSYNHLQSLIVHEYGETHYNAREQPFLYAHLLLLTGQFEAAIEFLWRVNAGILRPHAVHMALALSESGLLALSVSPKLPLLTQEDTDPSPSSRINLARLVIMYCQKFQQTNCKEVLNYEYFLRNVKVADGSNLFKVCCCDLAVETSCFKEILGELAEDGTRCSGLIDAFFPSVDDCNSVIKMVAEVCASRALFEDAIVLDELCGDHEEAIQLMSSLLGQVLPMENTPGTPRCRVAGNALAFKERHRGRHLNCSSHTANNFNLMCDLIHFFDLFNQQDYPAALEVLHQIDLLPTTETRVEEYTRKAPLLCNDVQRNLPELLLATITIIHSEYNKQKTSTGARSATSRTQAMDQLRQFGQALTAFSATLPYSMPGDTTSQLVQILMRLN